jgi:hypothetical protein
VQDYIYEMSSKISVGAEDEDAKEKIITMDTPNRTQLQEADSASIPLDFIRIQLYAPPHRPCLIPGDADPDPEAAPERPHIRVWLFARLYKLCLIFTALAVLTSSIGVV